MAIVLNGTTGISGVNALSGVTTVSSSAANTPVVLQDSGSNTNTCRAWVNFNGTGTVAIRASFNVTSITDNGTGDYTVNFTTAMPDTNYSTIVSGNENNNQLNRVWNVPSTATSPTTSAIRMSMVNGGSSTRIDAEFVYVSVFR